MAQLQILKISDVTISEIRAYAAEVGLDADVVAEEALSAGMATLRRLHFFEPSRKDVEVSDALAILDRAGNEPPLPGDELPENYRRNA